MATPLPAAISKTALGDKDTARREYQQRTVRKSTAPCGDRSFPGPSQRIPCQFATLLVPAARLMPRKASINSAHWAALGLHPGRAMSANPVIATKSRTSNEVRNVAPAASADECNRSGSGQSDPNTRASAMVKSQRCQLLVATGNERHEQDWMLKYHIFLQASLAQDRRAPLRFAAF